MADWSKNNLACRTTWLALRMLEQSKKTFSKSGTVRMDQMLFWNAADTVAIRTAKARTIATQLDNIFRLSAEATYETGKKRIQSIADMVTVMTQAAQTMADLAATNDQNYLFFGELP